jgi:hypothetical protein
MSIRSSLHKKLVAAGLLSCLLIAAGLPRDRLRVRARSSSHNVEFTAPQNQTLSIARQPNRLRPFASQWKGLETQVPTASSVLLLLRWGSPADAACLFLQFLSGFLRLGRSPPPALL